MEQQHKIYVDPFAVLTEIERNITAVAEQTSRTFALGDPLAEYQPLEFKDAVGKLRQEYDVIKGQIATLLHRLGLEADLERFNAEYQSRIVESRIVPSNDTFFKWDALVLLQTNFRILKATIRPGGFWNSVRRHGRAIVATGLVSSVVGSIVTVVVQNLLSPNQPEQPGLIKQANRSGMGFAESPATAAADTVSTFTFVANTNCSDTLTIVKANAAAAPSLYRVRLKNALLVLERRRYSEARRILESIQDDQSDEHNPGWDLALEKFIMCMSDYHYAMPSEPGYEP